MLLPCYEAKIKVVTNVPDGTDVYVFSCSHQCAGMLSKAEFS